MYSMDLPETRLDLHVIPTTSFMAYLLARSILWVVFRNLGAVSRSSKITFHIAGRVIKTRSSEEDIDVTLLSHSSHSCQRQEPSGTYFSHKWRLRSGS
jgi:hypothetical protein